MIYQSTLPELDIPDVSVPAYVLRRAKEIPDNVALVDGLSGDSLTLGQVTAYAERVAAWLAEQGIGKGDKVAIFSPNTIYYPVLFHGIAMAGAVSTTINSLYTAKDVLFQLNDSGARLIFTISAFVDRVVEAVAEHPVDAIVVLDGAEGYPSLRDVLASTGDVPEVDIDPATDLVTLPYSSGTTGFPKGVMLTHRNLVANVAQSEACMSHISPDDAISAVLPFFHIYGMTVLMNLGLSTGATLVTLPRFELEPYLKSIQEHKVTWAFVAPPIIVALTKHPAVANYDLSSLKVIFSGAAPLDEELALAAQKKLGVQLRQGYGMTELSPVSHTMPDALADELPKGSIGVSLPNVECRLVDPATGKDAELGEPGELWVRGPNVMLGYLNNDEATAATIDDEKFLHTGDVAIVDERGVYTIVDRVKELIKYKGYQVAPAELEAVLLANDDIADAAVIGVYDEEGGEAPKAFVVRAAGSDIDEAGVMAYVTSRVSPHKKVRHVEFVDEIPKSSSGKILRKDLRAREKATA